MEIVTEEEIARIVGKGLWWRADTQPLADAAAVTTLIGEVNSYNGTQSTAGNKPTFRMFGGPNGTPAIQFDGGDYLLHDYSGEPNAIFALVRCTNVGANNVICGAKSTDAVAIDAYYAIASNTSSQNNFARAVTGDTSGAVNLSVTASTAPSNVWYLWEGRLNGRQIEFFRQGEFVGRAYSSQSYTRRPIDTATGCGIVGADFYNGSPADYLTGSIAELIICPSTPSDAARAKICQWMTRHFGGPAIKPYIGWCFSSTAEGLYVLQSEDAVTWTSHRASFPVPAGRSVRDPSVIYDSIGKRFWCYYTCGGASGAFADHTQFGVATSLDGFFWTHVALVDMSAYLSGTTRRVWGPKGFIDEDGSIHVCVALSVGGTAGPFVLREMHPTDTKQTAWDTGGLITVNGSTSPANIIDAGWIRKNGQLYLYYKDEAASSLLMQFATGSSITGPFTQTTAGDWAGWGQVEGPCPMHLGGNRWIMSLDDYTDAGLSYSISVDDWATWSALTAFTINDRTNEVDLGDITPRNGCIMRNPHLGDVSLEQSNSHPSTFARSSIVNASGHVKVGSFAANAIDADALATDAVNEIAAAVEALRNGPGAVATIFTVTVSAVPLADADIWLTSDEAGSTVVAGTLQTNVDGEATFMLDDGSTYYAWVQKEGYNAVRAEAVVGGTDETITTTAAAGGSTGPAVPGLAN